MKTRMKMFAALAITMGFVSSAMAQTSLTGKATVLGQVVVSKTNDLDFMNVTPGITKTIAPNGDVTGVATGGETAGQFTFTKAINTSVTLEFTALPLVLTKVSSTENFAIAYTARLTTGSTILPITPVQGSPIMIDNATKADFFTASSFTLDLGGSITPPIGQLAGSYASTITLTATYN